MDDIAIRLEGVSKYYKLYDSPNDRLKEALNPFGKLYHQNFYALKNINVEVKKGEVLGIVGKNGSGKSTLLKIITGVLTPNDGKLIVNGRISALLELGAGFNPEFTGIQNIYFYGSVLGFSRKEMDEKLDSILAFAEIGVFVHQPLKIYSSGMKSRLGFAVAVHIDPDILILDEVLSVGDALFQRKCVAKMQEFFEGGKTVIYVSHNINSVNELCSRAIFLFEGSVLLDSDTIDSDTRTVTNYYLKHTFSENDDIRNDIEKISQKGLTSEQKEPGENLKENGQFSDECSTSYIKNFLPKTTVRYQNYDVEISHLRITTLDYKKVNILNVHERYKIQYRVDFKINATSVLFGFSIKNETGVNASGENAGLSELESSVTNGDSIFVEKEFYCSLVSGDYYLTVGVVGVVNEERKTLSKIMDGLVFRVRKAVDTRYFGYFLMNGKMSAKKMHDFRPGLETDSS